MKKAFTVFYSALLLLCSIAGMVVVFYFSLKNGATQGVLAIVGIALSVMLAPIVHELGHVLFAVKNGMRIMLVKCFCFRYQRVDGNKRFSFVSPFLPDETQVTPKFSGNMKKRVARYTLGGLIFSGIFLVLLAVIAWLWTAFLGNAYLLFGMLPYAIYLLLLNAAPLIYPSGKTDARVYLGLKKGDNEEKVFLSAMEIQGRLGDGKSFSEIDKTLYFDLPQLPEDEPLFAVISDLKYRFYLEKNELEKAADCLNRLAGAQAYLSASEEEKLLAELTYMHALNGDFEGAETCGKGCKTFLKSENVIAKRALAAYSLAFGELDAAKLLVEQAYGALEREENEGLKKAEAILISRIKQGIKEREDGNK